MTSEGVVFALVPIAVLRAHERVVPAKVRALAAELERSGVFADPIWVARGTDVILNGHHRAAALQLLGAARIPAWLIDYEGDLVRIDRWRPGPPISKAEVVRRARNGALFPPQTTRHVLAEDLPRRPTPLAKLLDRKRRRAPAAHPRGSTARRRPRS
jgi:L-serine kinase (ADP)